jgi:hypothetical protein
LLKRPSSLNPGLDENKATQMEKIEIEVQDTGKAINPAELAEFLYLFGGAAVGVAFTEPTFREAAIKAVTPEELAKIANGLTPSSPVLRDIERRLKGLTPEAVTSLFDAEQQATIFEIESISRKSPLLFVACGIATVMCFAVVLSGGSIEIKAPFTGLKAKLPPIGTGIQKLKEALGLSNKISVGFGVREIKVKLNKQEFDALTVPVRGEGGFQNFLRSLQDRVNHQTRCLVLSESDLEKIYRYKASPDTGGFQGRVEKIFSRHFPENRSLKLLANKK